MRRFCVIGVLILGLLVLAASAAARTRAPGDGSLSVQQADGLITISGRGALLGQFERGKVTIEDPRPGDGRGAVVAGCERLHSANRETKVCSGTDVRFSIIGGFFRVRVTGTDISLSFAGRGNATLVGTSGLEVGS